jgi:hypothetical protein
MNPKLVTGLICPGPLEYLLKVYDAAMAQDPNRTDIRIYAKDGGWVFDFTLAPYGPDTLLKLEAFLRLIDEVEG